MKAYAEMMKELWLGNKTIVNPSVFKYQLGSFASQFRGNDQHDAQEFLAFLLDGKVIPPGFILTSKILYLYLWLMRLFVPLLIQMFFYIFVDVQFFSLHFCFG